MSSVHDADVRSVLYTSLREQHARELNLTRIIDEFDLAGAARVDVAVVNGVLAGYEIKSERDTLRRLDAQVSVYSSFFDTVTVVAAAKHVDAVRANTPPWWAVVAVRGQVGSLELVVDRVGTTNPSVDPYKLCLLLWRDELIAELCSRHLLAGVRSKPRLVLGERLASNTDIDEVRALVRARLRARRSWRAAQ